MDADSTIITRLLSVRTTLAQLLSIPLEVFAFSVLLTFLMLVLRTIVRRDAIAVVLAILVSIVTTTASGAAPERILLAGALALLASTCLIRFGLVAVVAYFLTGAVLNSLRAALAWNSGAGGLVLAAIVALTLGAAYLAMGSPKLQRAMGTASS